MRDVYRNSYLTISVARSRDSSEGCFSSRPTKHLSTKVGSINHHGQVYNIMAREKSPKVMFANMVSQPRHGPEFRCDWAALMRRFSLMQLSFDADRLPSHSGLAQDLECSETGRYLAGLWENELPWMIRWMSMGKDACRPSSTPNPPSWSWTSVENIWVS